MTEAFQVPGQGPEEARVAEDVSRIAGFVVSNVRRIGRVDMPVRKGFLNPALSELDPAVEQAVTDRLAATGVEIAFYDAESLEDRTIYPRIRVTEPDASPDEPEFVRTLWSTVRSRRERRAERMAGYVVGCLERGKTEMPARTSRLPSIFVPYVDDRTLQGVEERLRPQGLSVERFIKDDPEDPQPHHWLKVTRLADIG